MRGLSRALLALSVSVSAAGLAQQSEPSPPVALAPPVASSTTAPADHRINLDVVVTDKAGNPIPDLQQQDFTLRDDQQPRSITSFRGTEETGKASEPPVQIIFLLDAVNLDVRPVSTARQQLENFLRRDDGKLSLPTSLVIFTDTSTMIQPKPTRDGKGLADSLHANQTGLRVNGRSQGFHGAVDRFTLSLRAVQQLIAYEATQPGRKLLIWLSSGWPMLTGPGIELTNKDQRTIFNTVVALSKTLREARITLYSVDPLGMADAAGFRTFYYESFLKGVPFSKDVVSGDISPQVLAIQSGGKVLNSNNDVAELMARCVIDARAFYTLSFDSPPADHVDEYHSLEVKIDKPGLTARTRTGYYAQPYKDPKR